MATNPAYKNRKLIRSKDKSIIYYKNKKSLKDELKSVLKRLEMDTGNYLKLAEKNNYAFGYFAMIRLLAPVIDHLSQILPKKRVQNTKNKLLEDLEIPFPNIFAHIYRHALTHGDEPTQIEIGLLIITWHLTFGHNKHRIERVGYPVKTQGGKKLPHPVVIYIDLKKLYEDLVVYIKKASKDTSVDEFTWIQTSTRFIKSKPSNKKIVREVNALLD